MNLEKETVPISCLDYPTPVLKPHMGVRQEELFEGNAACDNKINLSVTFAPVSNTVFRTGETVEEVCACCVFASAPLYASTPLW